MLLTRLTEHADRAVGLPPPFYRIRPVRWAIRLTADGTPAAYSLAVLAGSDQPAGQPMAVPYIYRSGQRPPAALLADDLRYVTGYRDDGDSERVCAEADRKNQDFISLVARWRDSAPDGPVAQAVASFFERGLHKKLNIPGTAKATDVAVIMVDGQPAHERESAACFWSGVVRERKASAGKRKASASTGICLVCGQPGPLLGTIPDAVKAGAIPAGTGRVRDAQLVSVNKPAQGRGGKLQLASAPVCDR
jgi:CRISPR-associated protein Csd1